jgi:glucan-binding YG repeat protein
MGKQDWKRKTEKKLRIMVCTAVCTAMAGMTALGYTYGPGYESSTSETAANNPAYNTGWSNSYGPGSSGTNPLGNLSDENSIYAGGPGSEAAQKLLAEEENALYIYNTYRGGTWEKLADGRWRLNQPDGQPVSSQWAYVDGKKYLLDMYGIMITGWQKVNGKWYYFSSTGEMQTGWLLKEGKYYFLNADGDMATGWVNSLGVWYYLDATTGVMQTNTYVADGRYVNAEGALVE